MAAGNSKYCPTETEEEITFSNWCDAHGYTHWHVPQETFTKSWQQKAKNKAMGVLPGVSDHWVVLPTPRKPDGSLVVIELKRQFGNTPTDEQIRFLRTMEKVDNVTAVCCYGANEAITLCEQLQNGVFTTFDECWERTNNLAEKRAKKTKKTEKSLKTENDLPY